MLPNASNVRKSALLGVVERLAARGSSMLVSMVVAATSAPRLFGYYAIATLILTACQAMTDAPVRQIGPLAYPTASGRRLMRLMRPVTAVTGGIALFAYLASLSIAGSPEAAAALAPLAFVPPVWAIYQTRLVRLQRSESWAHLSRYQSIASIVSLGCALPLIAYSGILAASVQSLAAEAAFAVLLFVRPMARQMEPVEDDQSFLRMFGSVAAGNALGWSQAQVERLTLGALGGSAAVGIYSFAAALSRSLADAIGSGFVNVLRARLAIAAHDRRGSEVDSMICLASPVALVIYVTLSIGSVLILPRILSDQWIPAVKLVPWLALGLIPACWSWLLGEYLVRQSLGSSLARIQGFATGFGLLVGGCLALNLWVGVGAVVLREILTLGLELKVSHVPLSRFTYLIGAAAVSTALVLATVLHVYLSRVY